jgi:16S rRNA G966 N2-methylase RsmD
MPERCCPEDHAVVISWAPGYDNPAQDFAREHQLPIINETPLWRGLCLHIDAHGWSLRDHAGEMQTPFSLQFESRFVATGKDPLLNAMGRAKSVLDLTAGWGGDAVHIALSGRQVTSIERNPVVFCLLQQAHARLMAGELSNRLQFKFLDATRVDFLERLRRAPDPITDVELVYLDPMFADSSRKQAKAKKPMRLLQRLTEEEPSQSNEGKLFENALAIASRRVVVKRALKAPYISDTKPQGSIKSKLLRFDLYHP